MWSPIDLCMLAISRVSKKLTTNLLNQLNQNLQKNVRPPNPSKTWQCTAVADADRSQLFFRKGSKGQRASHFWEKNNIGHTSIKFTQNSISSRIYHRLILVIPLLSYCLTRHPKLPRCSAGLDLLRKNICISLILLMEEILHHLGCIKPSK